MELEQSTEEAACRRHLLEMEAPPLNALALGAKRHYTDGRDLPRRRTCFRLRCSVYERRLAFPAGLGQLVESQLVDGPFVMGQLVEEAI